MLALASAVAIPAWLAPVLVGLTAIGAAGSAVANALGAWVNLRRLEALDRQRTQREVAQHAEVMDAIQSKGTP